MNLSQHQHLQTLLWISRRGLLPLASCCTVIICRISSPATRQSRKHSKDFSSTYLSAGACGWWGQRWWGGRWRAAASPGRSPAAGRSGCGPRGWWRLSRCGPWQRCDLGAEGKENRMRITIGIHSTAQLQVDTNMGPKRPCSEKLLNLMNSRAAAWLSAHCSASRQRRNQKGAPGQSPEPPAG